MLAQSLEQPRIVKRIVEKSHDFKRIHVLGFKRSIHSVKNYSLIEELPNVELTFVASFHDSKYINRFGAYLKLLFLLYSKYGIRKKSIYAFGMDLRIISALMINKKVQYEISDILWLYKKPSVRFVLASIDKLLARRSDKVIFTSKGFYLKHYNNSVKPENTVINENKFKSYGKVSPVDSIRVDKLRVAYIGAFRYAGIIDALLNVVSDNKNIELNFYGDGNSGIVDRMKNSASIYNNINYNGPFKNPDDLGRIYANNNLNFVVYDNSLENEQVAMPNKYYESGFFNIPIVCATNTYVGQRVVENGMGWITGTNEEEIAGFLNSIKINDLEHYHDKIKKLDKAQFHC